MISLDHPDFGINNLPYGVCQDANGTTFVCVAIDESVLDMASWAKGVASADSRRLPAEVVSALCQVCTSR